LGEPIERGSEGMGQLSNSTDLARTTVRSLIECGVNTFVLSPGSRNAPLSIALYQASKRGLVDLHVKIDERGAGFFALGAAKSSNNYVAVVCTSGTAAANYHPAILEAHHGANNLLVITADRPARLRGTGANQTTNQINIFGDIKSHDIAAPIDIRALLVGGPVHLNIQFDEPLLPTDSNDWLAGLEIAPIESTNESCEALSLTEKSVIVIGHDRGTFSVEEVREAVAGLRIPIVAEDPISFPEAIAHASIFLADEGVRRALKADQVIVIGRTTLSRSINAFINEATHQIVIDPRMAGLDIARSANQKFHNLPFFDAHLSGEYFDIWNSASKSAHSELHNLQSFSEHTAVRSIVENLPVDCALFIGSSRPIRDIEAFVSPRKSVTTFANRGLAGIDGNISTAFGIAEKFERSYAILGDLTFMHDLSALVAPTTANLTIFVIDNNGGGIFSTLPQAGVAGFEEIFGTPQNVNLERVVAGYGIAVEKVKTHSDIERVIAARNQGLRVVIVEVPARSEMAAGLKEIYQSVSSAVRIGLNLA
jgi:2-succinyl-5-enolpyruvyl-6-hydroxy-3-cyclohexene-1-carboxylate synthase